MIALIALIAPTSSVAFAAPGPQIAITTSGQAAGPATADTTAALAGALGAIPIAGPVAVEAQAHGGIARAGAPALGARIGARAFLGGPLAVRLAGGLLATGMGPKPEALAAVSWDLPLADRAALRIEAGASLLVDAQAAVLSVGPVFDLRRRAAPAPAPEPPPAPVGPLLEVRPADARVLLPHPVCEWVPVSESRAYLAEFEASGTPVTVVAPGFLPSFVVPGEGAVVDLQPAPPQGSLIVAALPGDEVSVGGVPVAEAVRTDAGAVVIRHPEGATDVVVAGGGRRQRVEVAVASGYATWIRIAPPEPIDLAFATGSAEISADDDAALAALAADLGGWRLLIRGGASYEGDPLRNEALGRARADAAAAALIAYGVAADAIEIVTPEVGTDDGVPEAQRRAWIQPVSPEAP